MRNDDCRDYRLGPDVSSKLRPGIRVIEYLPIDAPDHQGTYEAWWGQAYVHVKVEDKTKPLGIANELICTRLAAALGLPTLPGEIAQGPDGETCWVTPRVMSKGGASPPPARESNIAAEHPIVVAGMIAFDSWVHNTDRTADNVLFDPRLGVWLIDHENSLAEPDGRAFARKAAEVSETRLGYHGFTSVPVDNAALELWVQRVNTIGEHVIERPVAEAYSRGLVTREQQKWLARFLIDRRRWIRHVLPLAPGPSRIVIPPEDTEQGSLELFGEG